MVCIQRVVNKMKELKPEKAWVKYISYLGIIISTIIFINIFIHGPNSLSFIICTICLIGIYHPLIMYRRMNKEFKQNDELEQKINSFKDEIVKLESDVNSLTSRKDNLNLEITNLIKEKDLDKDKCKKELESLKSSIKDLEDKKEYIKETYRKEALDGYLIKAKEEYRLEIEKSCKDLDIKYKSLNENFDTLKNDYEKLKDEYDELNSHSYGLVPTEFEFEKSETYKMKLNNIHLREKEQIARLNKKVKNGSKVTLLYDNLEKLAFLYFNNACNYNLSKLKYNNYPTRVKEIEKLHSTIFNVTEYNVDIPTQYKDLKLEELETAYSYYKLKDREKEMLREQREQEKDDLKAQKEIKEKHDKIDKEIETLSLVKEKIEEKIKLAADEEINSLKLELEKLREKISEFQNEKSDLDYRLENTGAGYVYIISNIGSFGENVYKIGVTRRLDPYQRIQELSSASVPFKFDVHAMIFSYQAYQLENELHKYFDKQRINKINNRKEFFNIDIEQIKRVLSSHKELTFDFIEEATAQEYKESLNVIDR